MNLSLGRRDAVARIAAAALTSLVLAACSTTVTVTAPHQSAATTRAALPQSPATSATAQAVTPSSPPLDLRTVNWSTVSIPGQFCYVPGTVRLEDVGATTSSYGEATARSSRWGNVKFIAYTGESKVIYGNLGGNAGEIAALNVVCTNGSGTADGLLVASYMIFTGAGGKLAVLGAVTPQEQLSGRPASLISGVVISQGTITAHEDWYHQSDAVCCATGRAVTVWAYANGKLTPGAPDVTAGPAE